MSLILECSGIALWVGMKFFAASFHPRRARLVFLEAERSYRPLSRQVEHSFQAAQGPGTTVDCRHIVRGSQLKRLTSNT